MSQARREAFSRLDETCPKVKDAMRAAVKRALDGSLLTEEADHHAMAYALADAAFEEAVSEGTTPLRDALIECEEERLTAARERDDLTEEVATLKRRVEELEDEVKDAERRANEAEAQVS